MPENKKLSRKELRKLEEKRKKEAERGVISKDSGINLTLNQSTLHDLLAPSGIDATHYDYLEIFSKIPRFARTFYVTTIPRQATFPYFLSGIYEFGDVNTSVYITPVPESQSQNELNKTIVELQSERFVAQDRGDINREATLSTKQAEADAAHDKKRKSLIIKDFRFFLWSW